MTLSLPYRYTGKDWAARNHILDTFLKSKEKFLLMYDNRINPHPYDLDFGPPTLVEALEQAHEETRAPAIALPGPDSVLLSQTLTTEGRTSIRDSLLFISRPAVEVVRYFRPISGVWSMTEYLARINRASGFCPEHFTVLANSGRWVRVLEESVEDKAGEAAYLQSLQFIRTGSVTEKVKANAYAKPNI